MDNIEIINSFFYDIMIGWGFPESTSNFINVLILATVLGLGIYILIQAFSWIFRLILRRISRFDKLPFVKHLLESKFPYAVALIFPYILLKITIPIVFYNYPKLSVVFDKAADVYIVYVLINCILSAVKAFFGLLSERAHFKGKPTKSYVQIISIILWLMGAVVIFSILTGMSPAKFFAAMGAASAVLMLMFKDTIMGFVASVQVTTNDMVRLGDWITMPKYGADGDVIDIALTTVKVQNFDKTITTIPTYALISDSFQNWRGMFNSGGRRIKRAIIIKQNSIRYISDEEIPRFMKIQGIADYIEERQQEINEHNDRIGADRSILVNGRNLTNSGLFRKYITWYLENHPGINKNMLLMVRQLAPTEKGLPFELYAFTASTNWIQYESAMSDIFDHLIAAVTYFDLELFEIETGIDARFSS